MAYPHVFEWRFFEISGDPYPIQRNYCEQLLPWVYIQADDNFLRDLPGSGRQYPGVSQIQLCLLDSSAFLLYIGHR